MDGSQIKQELGEQKDESPPTNIFDVKGQNKSLESLVTRFISQPPVTCATIKLGRSE